MIALTEKLTDTKYELPMAYVDSDLQFLSYAQTITGVKG
jgi:hypothetical protein